MPEILLPYQSAWVADRSRVKVWEKSRRIGASYGEAFDSVVEAALSRDEGGQSSYYLSYNKEMTQQFIKDCGFWAKILNVVAGDMEELVLRDEDKDITVYRIRFASGFDIWGLPSEARSLRSKQGRVIIDEAAFVDDLPELLKAANALLMWGGSVRIISTHNGDDNPFNDLVQEIRAGKKAYSLHRTTLDDALEGGLFQRICQTTGKAWTPEEEARWREALIADYGDGADEELFCIPASGTGSFLTRNMIESVMASTIPVIRWQPPSADFVDWPLDRAMRETRDWCEEYLGPILARLDPSLRSFFGEDFGRSGDLTVIHPVQETRTLDLVTPFLLELRNCPFRTQRQILFYVLDRLPKFAGGAMDARGNGQALAEETRQEYGSERIEEVMLSESWYREHMPKLKAQFEDRTWSLPKDNLVMDDYRALKIVRGVPKVPDVRTQGAGGKRHGDAAVAGAMAVFAAKTMEGGGRAEYKSISKRRMSRRGAW
jgi:phage FluMu gp28-like protein